MPPVAYLRYDKYMSKEAYVCEKRPTYVGAFRGSSYGHERHFFSALLSALLKYDTHMSKEADIYEKRPTYMKRDVQMDLDM